MHKKSLLDKSKFEIEALGQVIKYAERMISEGQFYPYSSLRRHAFGKTVVIDSEKKGEIEYRLSSTSAVIVPNKIGYATPHSPIGRLCSFVDHGFNGESLLLGDYRISEVRKFDRFDGVNFEENVLNFLRMHVINDNLNENVDNLFEYISNKKEESLDISEPEINSSSILENDDLNYSSKNKLNNKSIASIIKVLAENIPEKEIVIEADSEDNGLSYDLIKNGSFYGLNEAFFLNRTINQNKVIARTPIGPMLVLGVAGSGKTSAALGRTKMLCDFSINNVSTKEEFEAVLDKDHDYWEGRYAGKFSQEGSVGFVKTGELIQYLKETCRRIDLPNLPVLEYKELQIRLKIARGLEKQKWSICSDVNVPSVLSSIDWLKSALQVMSLCIKDKIEENSTNRNNLINILFEEQTSSSYIAYQHILRNTKIDLINFLEMGVESELFWFDGLIENLRGIIDRNLNIVFGENSFWVQYKSKYLIIERNEFAKLVLNENNYIFDKNKNLILRYEKIGNEYKFINKKLCVYVNIIHRNIKGKKRNIVIYDKFYIISDIQDTKLTGNLKMSSLNDAVLDLKRINDIKNDPSNREKIIPEDAARISIMYASIDINLKAELTDNEFFIQEHIQPGFSMYTLENLDDFKLGMLEAKFYKGVQFEKKITIKNKEPSNLRTELKKHLQDNFINKIFNDMLALYLVSIKKYSHLYKDNHACKYILALADKKSLNNEIIDLVLCAYQLVSANCNNSEGIFSCPKYYQSVFIDEMQDFTELQIFLMSRQADPKFNSVTIVGDYAQKIKIDNAVDIEKCFPNKFIPTIKLTENLRQLHSPRLAVLSSIYRKEFIDGTEVPESLLSRAKQQEKYKFLNDVASDNELDLFIISKLSNLKQFETAAVIFPTHDIARVVFSRINERLQEMDVSTECSMHIDISRKYVKHFTGVENTKGLEFDYVLLVNIEKYSFEESIWRNRFYVGITRASKTLDILVLGKSSSINMLRKLGNTYNKYLDY